MKKTIKHFLLLTTWMLSGMMLNAQYYYYNTRFYETNMLWEIGAAATGMNGLTDLGGKRIKGQSFLNNLDWRNTRPGITIFGKFLYNETIALRLEAGVGKIVAYDSLLKNKLEAPGRFHRNLHVETNIIELLLLAELYPLTLLAAGEHPVYWLTPYLIAGVGYFHFNPVAKLDQKRVSLQPLHTEGQGFPEYPNRKPYRLSQWNLPLGVGFRYELSALLVCGAELVYRKLFTDYLDDVSTTYIETELFYKNLSPAQATIAAKLADQSRKDYPLQQPGNKRGNPGNNDAYLSFNLKIALALGRARR